jgi:hypothetical protein
LRAEALVEQIKLDAGTGFIAHHVMAEPAERRYDDLVPQPLPPRDADAADPTADELPDMPPPMKPDPARLLEPLTQEEIAYLRARKKAIGAHAMAAFRQLWGKTRD